MVTFVAAVTVAMGVSFLCSVMEAALLSLQPGKIALLSQKNPKIGRICEDLKADIEKPIAVILILNTTAHTFGASIAGAQFDKLFGAEYIWLFSLLFTIFMVQFTEILPKTLGVRFNGSILRVAAFPLKLGIKIIHPLIWLVHFINRPFETKENIVDGEEELEAEIDALALMARKANHITEAQENAIHNIPDLSDDTISEIMTTRAEMVTLNYNDSRDEVIRIAHNSPHSRYPVVSADDPEKFLGVLYIRDLLFNPGDWQTSIRPVVTVNGGEAQLMIAENLEKLDSKLLLVKDHQDKITGMFTTNDLMMNLFKQ